MDPQVAKIIKGFDRLHKHCESYCLHDGVLYGPDGKRVVPLLTQPDPLATVKRPRRDFLDELLDWRRR